MYLIAINKIIKCFLFPFLYSLFPSYFGFFFSVFHFFYFPVLTFFFHSYCIFFFFFCGFLLHFFKFIFLCLYFFVFALCFCHSKFFYKLPFSHCRLFVLQVRSQRYPFSSASSHLVVLLSLSHFTDFSFCLFHHSHYCILCQDTVFSWFEKSPPLAPTVIQMSPIMLTHDASQKYM